MEALEHGGRATGTLREDVTWLAALAGVTLTAVQEEILASGMAKGPDGKWARSRVAVPDGQDEVLRARELAGLFLLGERILHVSAGHGQSAGYARRMTELVTGSPELASRVTCISRVNGGQEIRLRDGEIRFRAAPLYGRGYSADLIVSGPGCDDQAAALLPCAASRPGPQVWMTMESRRTR